MSTSSIKSDDTVRLKEAKQGQATPIGDRSRQITTGNLVLDDEDYSPCTSSAAKLMPSTIRGTEH